MEINKKTIDGKTFKCNKMPASKATYKAMELSKILSPLLKATDVFTDENASDLNNVLTQDLSKFSNVLMDMQDQKIAEMVIEFCESCFVQKAQGNFESVIYDVDFSDNLATPFKVAVWYIKVNFGNFLQGLFQGN